MIKQVWTHDDISPASFLYSYRESNILYEWNPNSMSRLLPTSSNSAENLEVLVNLDGTIFFVKEHGNFISHLQSNL